MALAVAAARAHGLPYLARRRKEPLEALLSTRAEACLVFGGDGVALWDAEGCLRFSPGMARLRVKRIDAGHLDDRLVRLAELSPGASVLDCTLGLAADAIVLARAVGPHGKVVGVEKSPALAALAGEGMAAYDFGPRSCQVEVVRGDFAEVLAASADGAFDCVFFDPMFARPRRASPAFDALRRFADRTPLSAAAVAEARRVARRWVIVKGSRYSTDLRALGLSAEPGPRTATVVWARLRASGG